MHLKDEKKRLNPQQLQAVEHIQGPMLVLAGAGSGKTKVATLRIAQMIESGISAENIVGVTFTNKAAQEMKKRVDHYVGCDVLISTFHSLGVRILRESIHHLGFTNDFAIYDEQDSERLVKEVIRDLGLSQNTKIKEVRTLLSNCKNDLNAPAKGDQYIFPVYERYQEKLKSCNAVDFDDLLFLPNVLFEKFPEILQQYQSRWQYILVDEYQDTNHAQYSFVKSLSGARSNVFVVGDPDQSIYSWRGANIDNILRFEKDFPGAQVVRLEQNYRSTATILQAANTVIEKNAKRFDKKLWSALGDGDKIQLFVADNERQEAYFVIDSVQKLVTDKGACYNDITILYRTNFQSRLFEDACFSKRIPYTIVGGISFYQRKEVKDILGYLRLLDNPKDRISFARIINLPKRSIGDTTITKLLQAQDSANVPILDFLFQMYRDDSWDSLDFSLATRQKKGLIEFTKLMLSFREIQEKDDLSALVGAVIRDSGYREVLEQEPETRQERLENIEELHAKAMQWQQDNQETELSESPITESLLTKSLLTKFLEELTLATSHDRASSDTPSISLMTLHNAKGLEFRYTFLVGLEEGLFPHIISKEDSDDVEEERRLFYVGITRAKEKLWISCARRRTLWGATRAMHPSKFLHDIPLDLFQKVSFRHASTYTPPSASYTSKEEFQEEDIVLHATFGVGKILRSYTGSMGPMVDVHFSNIDEVKKLVLQYASLKKV